MLLIILVQGFCPLKIKILLLSFLVDSVLIHLIISPPSPSPLPSICIEVKTGYHDVLICTTIACFKALFLFLF